MSTLFFWYASAYPPDLSGSSNVTSAGIIVAFHGIKKKKRIPFKTDFSCFTFNLKKLLLLDAGVAEVDADVPMTMTKTMVWRLEGRNDPFAWWRRIT
jgi:hypothetical protein